MARRLLVALAFVLAGCAEHETQTPPSLRHDHRPAQVRPGSVRPAPAAPALIAREGLARGADPIRCPGASASYGRLWGASALRHVPVDRQASATAWLAAQGCAESVWRADAVSPAGAAGVMQLMPGTARDLGLAPEARFEPRRNIAAGARYMGWLVRQFNRQRRTDLEVLRLATASYNAGLGNVLDWQRTTGCKEWTCLVSAGATWSEPREYVARVERLMAGGAWSATP